MEVSLKALVGEDRTTKNTTSRETPRMQLPTNVPAGGEVKETVAPSNMASWSGANGSQEPAKKPEDAPEPEALSTLDQFWKGMSKSVNDMKTMVTAIRAPLPTQTGDGSQLIKPPDRSIARDISEILKDVNHLGIDKIADLVEVAEKMKRGIPLDDKKYLMEYLIQAASSLPDDITGTKITDDLLTTLWNDLEHPPQMLLSDDFIYRQPDGSKNSYALPHIGQAGMPYARSVAPKSLRSGTMPDPGVLFDTLMKRKDGGSEKHPNRISSMLFYLASIIIHDCFKTNRDDFNVSDTSSYLDLAPLYGSNWEEQKAMRTFKDGKIKADCFSETRLLQFPPGVGALLIMFNRYHNYVVEQLAAINEDGRFSENRDPKKRTVERYGTTVDRRDDDLFQTARLITCGLYVNIILLDYVRTILNLNRTDVNWQLNPRAIIPDGPPRGTGNQVSCEFNLVYRWHSSISARDEGWTEELWKEVFQNPKDPKEEWVDPEMKDPKDYLKLRAKLKKDLANMDPDPQKRVFPALESDRAGGRFTRSNDDIKKFKDDDLAEVITSSIEDCANAMGPQMVPKVLKAIEIMGIMQTRTWRCATLNEFRQHFALEPHTSFDSITKNKEVADALRHLYGTPDQVELYPGLVVEDAKDPMLPGAGLCPSYTVSRAVLSDATALVRGDRFYTTSYTPAALTSWGYKEASSDPTIDNGCVLYKLFLRALPNNYDPSSVYVHYPLTIPQDKNGMKDVLERLGNAHKYNFDRPKPIPPPTVLFSYDACLKVMDDKESFHVTWGKAMEFLMGPDAKNFMLAGDAAPNAASRKLMAPALYQGGDSRAIPKGNEKWLTDIKDFYTQITIKLLHEKSYKLGGKREVDIIRDVGNLAHVHFAAEMFSLPLKTATFPHGIFTEQQLYLVMAAVFIAVFFDVDPPKSFPLRQQAYEATQSLGKFMEVLVRSIQATGSIGEKVVEYVNPTSKPLQAYGVRLISQLLKANPNVKDLVWGNIMGTLGGMAPPQGQLFGQVMDFFMDPKNAEHWKKAQQIAKDDGPDCDEKLMHYLMEAARLNGESGVVRYATKDITIEDDTGIDVLPKSHTFKAGDKVVVNVKAASRDKKKYGENADEVDLNRPLDSYLQMGHGPHQCLGLPMTRVALTAMLKVIARLDGLQPAAVSIGPMPTQSKVKKVVKEFVPGDLKFLPESWHFHAFLTEDWDMYFPFPTNLKVNWNEA